MKYFAANHSRQISGTLQCFDRVIFKGHLKNISYADGLEKFIARRGLKIKDFAAFVKNQADQLVLHAKTIAEKQHRTYRYLESRMRKDDAARDIAQKSNIQHGLICVFSELETCPSFKIAYGIGRPQIISARRKCLCIYYYFMHRELGLIHVRIQTWFPFVIQIAVNGHEWLAIQMRRQHMAFEQLDNAFIKITDPHKAQQLICACTCRVTHNQRTYRGFNPAAQEDIQIFRALCAGQHSLHGFRNANIRCKLYPPSADIKTQRILAAKVSRILKRFHVRGLIAKKPHSRRWRLTNNGHAFISMAIKYHDEFYPKSIAA